MGDILSWFFNASTPIQIAVWVLLGLFVLSIVKRLVKVALLVTILIILIFVALAVAG